MSNFNTINVTDMSTMFELCSSLVVIYGSNWDTNQVSSGYGLFYNCTNLVGGQGTKYSDGQTIPMPA